MRICVIHPKACTESARELAASLGADCRNPYTQGIPHNCDWYFNYGTVETHSKTKQTNLGTSVYKCINKLTTFQILEAAGVPIPKYTTSPKEAAKWDIVVCRDSVDGRANEGMSYHYPNQIPKTKGLPKGKLFTEYFEHVAEYRIVVFKGKVVGRYRKDVVEESWHFTLMTKQGFEDIDRSCLQAAQALQIDYVGFDVLENKKGVYVVLEANSGPILTEEAKKAIVKYFKGLYKEKK